MKKLTQRIKMAWLEYFRQEAASFKFFFFNYVGIELLSVVAEELEPGTTKYKTISAKLKHHAVLYPSLLFFLSITSPLIKILDKSEGL